MESFKNLISKMTSPFAKIFADEPVTVMMLGLDAAGKTTILYRLKLGEVVTTIPTIGFNVETVENKHVNFTAWDVGGRGKIRPLWKHYAQNTEAIVFVVDSNDRERMESVKEEIYGALRLIGEIDAKRLQKVPVLVYLNKQDLPNAMSSSEIYDKLELNKIKCLKGNSSSLTSSDLSTYSYCYDIYLQLCSATDPNVNEGGLYDGLEWLAETSGRIKYERKQTKKVNSYYNYLASLFLGEKISKLQDNDNNEDEDNDDNNDKKNITTAEKKEIEKIKSDFGSVSS